MRSVALRCNVALGSLYNYFPSKGALISATIQSVWQDIFHIGEEACPSSSFPQYIEELFNRIKNGALQYPEFFINHSINFAASEKGEAKRVMEFYFLHIKSEMQKVMISDGEVSKGAFSDRFSQEEFIDFVFQSLLSLLMQQKNSCNTLIEIIRRTIYGPPV